MSSSIVVEDVVEAENGLCALNDLLSGRRPNVEAPHPPEPEEPPAVVSEPVPELLLDSIYQGVKANLQAAIGLLSAIPDSDHSDAVELISNAIDCIGGNSVEDDDIDSDDAVIEDDTQNNVATVKELLEKAQLRRSRSPLVRYVDDETAIPDPQEHVEESVETPDTVPLSVYDPRTDGTVTSNVSADAGIVASMPDPEDYPGVEEQE